MPSGKMKVEEQGGINWTWFKVQKGNLVAVFRLHYDEDQLSAFHRLEKKMAKVKDIPVPFATWREPCNVVANHTDKSSGYRLPEVEEAFGWLAGMFKDTAGSSELEFCAESLVRHLEYHGVAICRV